MSDLLDGADVRQCSRDGCDATFVIPPGATGFAAKRSLCDEHSRSRKKPPRDLPPPSITINAAPKSMGKDADLARVEARAQQLAGTLAAVVLLSGHPEDATDIERGSRAWASSVRQLAVHEEWLRRALLSSGTPDRLMAWISFGAATLGVTLPVMVRHGWLPDNMRSLATQVLSVPVPAPADAPDLAA